jgi:ankyrin repeat protein
MYAEFYGNEELAALLLSRGAKVNDVDLDGYSALMVAAYHGSDGRIAALLLRAGANVNLRNKRGGTALTSAAFSGDEIAVQELVAAGADLSANDRSPTLSVVYGLLHANCACVVTWESG